MDFDGNCGIHAGMRMNEEYPSKRRMRARMGNTLDGGTVKSTIRSIFTLLTSLVGHHDQSSNSDFLLCVFPFCLYKNKEKKKTTTQLESDKFFLYNLNGDNLKSSLIDHSLISFIFSPINNHSIAYNLRSLKSNNHPY
jgi:hypothetical protein